MYKGFANVARWTTQHECVDLVDSRDRLDSGVAGLFVCLVIQQDCILRQVLVHVLLLRLLLLSLLV